MMRMLGIVAGMALLAGCASMEIAASPSPSPSAPPSASASASASASNGAGGGADTVRLREEAVDLGELFEGMEGTFVLLDPAAGLVVRHDAARARRGLIPASTFKIPNTLIALETGVAPGPEFALAWDSVRDPRQGWWPEAWPRDHTLRTAFPYSVVWFYQEIARRVGPERMQAWVDSLDYGNRDISGRPDGFWLSGALRISADEQVGFLRRMVEGRLPVSPRSVQVVRSLMVLEETPAYRMSGKTGTAPTGEGGQVGWLVGFVERDGRVLYYALNVEASGAVMGPPQRRVGMARRMLERLGAIPGS